MEKSAIIAFYASLSVKNTIAAMQELLPWIEKFGDKLLDDSRFKIMVI